MNLPVSDNPATPATAAATSQTGASATETRSGPDAIATIPAAPDMPTDGAGRATAARPASPWAVFWISSIAVFLVSLDTTMLYAAFEAIRESYADATAPQLSWVLNAYTVLYAAMLIPAGGLADAHGRKKVFLLGVALFLLASALCGLAGSVAWLVAARALQAIGAALLTPASLSMVLGAFPQSQRAVVVSAWGAVGALAAAVGPSLGSLVIATAGWRWAFFINLPLGAISIWKGLSILREAPRPAGARGRIDAVGMALLVLAVGAIALSIVEAAAPGWSRAGLLGVAAFGIAALLAFVGWARVATAPLVDLDLFRHRTYAYANLATLTFGIAFSIMFFTFFFYMRAIWHYPLPLAGLAITPGPLLVMPVAIASGRLAARVGHRPLLVGGALVYGSSSLWFMLVPGVEPQYLTHWLPGLFLSGIGVGMTLPSLSAAAVNRLPVAQYAVGSAVNQATRQIGSVLGVAVTVLLLGGAALQRADFTPLYLLHASLAVATALLCLPIDTRPAVPTAAPVAEPARGAVRS